MTGKPSTEQKYERFASDYNRGLDRATLVAMYKIPDDKFDTFLNFLTRKGYVLSRSEEVAGASHEVDYEIVGDDNQFVEIELDPGETAIAEPGAMVYMDDAVAMETLFGDGSSASQSLMGKLFGVGKRVLTGESLFMTAYTNRGNGKKRVAFSGRHPGKIIPLDLAALRGEVLCQKDAFLCAAKGVTVDIAFQKRLGVGFFGGEGFILQRLKGDGLAFVHAGGTLVEKDLSDGSILKVDTGCLVAMEKGIHYDIEFVGGIRNAFFGGEGLFFATVHGTGKVWLQSMPFSRLADSIISSAPRVGGEKKGEGSLLGTIGGIVGGMR